MVNFNIVEGDDFYEGIHDEFITLYNQGVKVKSICERLGISNSQYQNYLRRLRRRNEITTVRNPNAGGKRQRRYDRNNPKNYHYSKRAKVFIVRYCDKYYACFKKEKDTKRFVECMRECDWDYSQRWTIKAKILRGEL